MIDQALALTEKLLPTLNLSLMGEYSRDDTRVTLMDIARDGVLIVKKRGIIGGSICGSPINRAHKIAYERVFYAEAGHRSLLKEFEAWGRENGAHAVALSCFSPRIAGIYQKSGYSPLEQYWVKEI